MGLVRKCLARLASRGMVAFSKKNDIHISNQKIGIERLATLLSSVLPSILLLCEWPLILRPR